jgi:hypothetical protein
MITLQKDGHGKGGRLCFVFHGKGGRLGHVASGKGQAPGTCVVKTLYDKHVPNSTGKFQVIQARSRHC